MTDRRTHETDHLPASRTFTAKYGGECGAGDEIEPGDTVCYHRAGGWADEEVWHADCAVNDTISPPPPIGPPLCMKCYTMHNGECW